MRPELLSRQYVSLSSDCLAIRYTYIILGLLYSEAADFTQALLADFPHCIQRIFGSTFYSNTDFQYKAPGFFH
jgi:hypothetical protein